MDTTTNTPTNPISCSHSKEPVHNERARKLQALPAEMPIASGAAGRVDVGVDTSTAWTPEGSTRKKKPVNRNCDSYLQRFQEQRKKNKWNLLQGTQDNTDSPDQGNDGAKEGSKQENSISEDPTSGKPFSGERTKKSLLCVIL